MEMIEVLRKTKTDEDETYNFVLQISAFLRETRKLVLPKGGEKEILVTCKAIIPVLNVDIKGSDRIAINGKCFSIADIKKNIISRLTTLYLKEVVNA